MDTLSLFNLKGKTVLITGSGSGIGLALAKGLAGAGAKIILNGRNESKLAGAEKQLIENGAAVSKLIFDVTNADDVQTAIKGYEKNQGPIDILINNAGINLRKPFEDFEEKEWKAILDINIQGAMIVSQAVAPFMIGR
ncbi:MAG: SDR family NAD(P)-dependent oxidoreductase, partial [Bacteroidia bacterium]|nr:SDR family NAD(P)-dependent oxidoreductase [Bacteroidia bacterium]